MSCNNCGNNNCSCGSVPTYKGCCETKTICPDSVVQVAHGDVTLEGGTGPVLVAERSFSIPACNEQAVISVLGEVQTPPGGTQVYVEKDGQVAYLTVISVTRFFEQVSNNGCNTGCETPQPAKALRTELTVLNQCLSCSTLAVGTFLEQGAPVILTAPDCDVASGGSGDLVLCDKLHVPEVGETVSVSVSPSTSGLQIGDIVQITDKKFQVESIPSATVVELKNLGEGGDPGTIIDGSDCLTVRIFIIAGDNPCSKTPVSEADYVRVCDDGNDTIIDINDGQVIGKEGGKIVGVDLPFDPLVCSPIVNCITLVIGQTSYALIVEDASNFEIGNFGYFDCNKEVGNFEITNIVGTTLTIEPDFVVDGSNEGVIADNCDDCQFCLAECCIELRKLIEDSIISSVVGDDTCEDGGIGAGYAVKSASVNGNVLTLNGAPEHTALRIRGTDSITGWNLTAVDDEVEITIEEIIDNSAGCRDMVVFINNQGSAAGFVSGGEIKLNLTKGFDNGGGSFSNTGDTEIFQANAESQSFDFSNSGTAEVLAGETKTIRSRFTLKKVAGAGAFNDTGNGLSGSQRGLAVTV